MLNRNPDLSVVLNSVEYPKILFAMLNGATFGAQLAKRLEKKQSTISQQLSILENYGLIRKTTRDKAQHYEIDGKELLGIAVEQSAIHQFDGNKLFSNPYSKKMKAEAIKKSKRGFGIKEASKLLTKITWIFEPDYFLGCLYYCLEKSPNKTLSEYLNDAVQLLMFCAFMFAQTV